MFLSHLCTDSHSGPSSSGAWHAGSGSRWPMRTCCGRCGPKFPRIWGFVQVCSRAFCGRWHGTMRWPWWDVLGLLGAFCFISVPSPACGCCHKVEPFGEKISISAGSVPAALFPSLLQLLLPLLPRQCHWLFPPILPADAKMGGVGELRLGPNNCESQQLWKASLVVAGSPGWQGGLTLFIQAQPIYSNGFLTRHPVNSQILQTEDTLAYLYCALALARLKNHGLPKTCPWGLVTPCHWKP